MALLERAWPLIPIAPAVVVIVSMLVACAIGVVGVDEYSRASDAAATDKARVLVGALSQRLAGLPEMSHATALRLAHERTGAEFLLFHANGDIISQASRTLPSARTLERAIHQTVGEIQSAMGRARYAVRAVPSGERQGLYLGAIVQAPPRPAGARTLARALVGVTLLLVLVAATASHLVAREANQNVVYVTRRVRRMAEAEGREPAGEPVPLRTMDEVGILTSAFNDLVGRFTEAGRRYRTNLDKADAADRDRAMFLAAVSHELRSPLNAILGFADLLLQEVDGPLTEEAREEIDQIRGSGQHLLELINDILEFSALEAGQLKLQRTQVDLVTIATSVLREAEALVAGRPIVLRLEGEPSLVAEVDPKRVRQILTNLVSNAIKFTASGNVVIQLTRRGSFVRINVTDTGPGISGEVRSLIFEDFTQVGDAAQRGRGTGLGLAIARRLVLMHGGSIEVESELGHGSSFQVSLPIGNAEFFAKFAEPVP